MVKLQVQLPVVWGKSTVATSQEGGDSGIVVESEPHRIPGYFIIQIN